MTFTAQPQPDLGAVLLTITGAAAGTTITRDAGDGPQPVRFGTDLAAGDHLLTDYECPLGVPATYSDGTDTATVVLESAYPWLSHPFLPLAVRVTVQNDTPRESEAPGTVLVPVDGGTPTVTYTPRNVVTGNLRIPSADDDVPFLSTLFADGSPLLLRTPPGCPIGDRWVWAGLISRDRPMPDGDLSWLDVPYTVVRRPADIAPSPVPWTWEQVPLAHTTWTAVIAAYGTWRGLLAGPAAAASRSGWSL